MSGPRIRAVVVDDSRLMRAMIRGALEAEGDIVCVGQAEDTSRARQVIKEANPDVVTLDIEMPGMNGLAFLQKIMELRPMPVVMVSTLTQAGRRRRSRRSTPVPWMRSRNRMDRAECRPLHSACAPLSALPPGRACARRCRAAWRT